MLSKQGILPLALCWNLLST